MLYFTVHLNKSHNTIIIQFSKLKFPYCPCWEGNIGRVDSLHCPGSWGYFFLYGSSCTGQKWSVQTQLGKNLKVNSSWAYTGLYVQLDLNGKVERAKLGITFQYYKFKKLRMLCITQHPTTLPYLSCSLSPQWSLLVILAVTPHCTACQTFFHVFALLSFKLALILTLYYPEHLQ